MKSRVRLLAAFAVVALLSTLNSQLSTALAQGTAFTYQGQLQNNGALANGTYNLQFLLYTNRTGGTSIAGPVTTNDVVVTNGLFTVTIDFGSGVWNGATNWLQVEVETNGGGSFTTLSPRQELTPTPYAIYAEGADASGLTGTIPMASFSGTFGGAVNLDNAGNSFTGNGAGLTGINALTLDGLGPNNFWQLTGNAGTTPGANYVGTTDNQALELHVDGQRAFRLEPGLYYTGTSIPNVIGGSLGNYVLPGTVGATIGGGGTTDAGDPDDTNTVGANFGTIAGGVGNNIFNGASEEATIAGGFKNTITNGTHGTISGGYLNTVSGWAGTVPGGENNVAGGTYSFAAGEYAQALHNNTFVWSDGSSTFSSTGTNQFLIEALGGVGIGTVAGPQQFLSVRGGLNIDQANLNSGYLNHAGTNDGYGLSFGSSSGEGIASKRTSGGNQFGLDFYTGFTDQMSIENNGIVQFNNDLYLQSVYNTPDAGLGWRTSVAGITLGEGGGGSFLWGYDGGALGTVDPNEVSLEWDYVGNVWISNNCSVASLTIRGGADLAEPFHLSSRQLEIPRGSVVVIDEKNPGQLKMSDRAYDTRVAGVLSGANGVNPGIQMQQQGLIEGDRNVALSGRVYVLADTANGAIQPGDLLTTSATPGYAMKVTNHAKAEGAILGKAMTSLNKGKGMILVLVTLQ